MKHDQQSRRAVLRGIAGTAVGLPLLDVFSRQARAAGPATGGDHAIFIVGCNGVMQANKGEPEMFWPRAAGALTKASLEADLAAKRSTGELAEHAERILIVKGVKLPFGSSGDQHNGGDAMILTAAHHQNSPHPAAFAESIDNRIAREKNPPGREPLVQRIIRSPKPDTGAVSYRGRDMPRMGDENPQAAYERMVGLVQADPGVAAQVQKKRLSVNDLIRGELKRVLGRTDLSADDRRRLDGHFTAIRDIENKLSGVLAPDTVESVKKVGDASGGQPKYFVNELADTVITVQMELTAFAIASGYSRTAVLKIGDRVDSLIWPLPGHPPHTFHHISHRNESGGFSGPTIANAVEMHHLVDRLYMRKLKWFIDRMLAIQTPQGPLLDQGYTAWTNQISVGTHGYLSVPWIIAGNARGYFKPGRMVQLGGANGSNLLLNTLLGAAGVSKADGSPVDDFGAADLAKGRLPELLATA